MDSLIAAMVAKQRDCGYSPNPGATPEFLHRWELENGRKLPPAMRLWLLHANGWTDAGKPRIHGAPDRIWEFPPLEIWSERYFPDSVPELRMRGYVGFADALIVAPIYGVCLEPASSEWGRIKLFDRVHGLNDNGYIASFESFACDWTAYPDDNFFESMNLSDNR